MPVAGGAAAAPEVGSRMTEALRRKAAKGETEEVSAAEAEAVGLEESSGEIAADAAARTAARTAARRRIDCSRLPVVGRSWRRQTSARAIQPAEVSE